MKTQATILTTLALALSCTFSIAQLIIPQIEWQNTIGGNSNDYLRSVQQTSDGGYILGGYSSSGKSGDKTEFSLGSTDYWVVKLDSAGVIEWQNSIGGNGEDVLSAVQQTSDGGYILGGYSLSGISGDKTEASLGYADYWIVKLSSTGAIQWQNSIGGDGYDFFSSIQQTFDGGYILGGYSRSGISGDKTEIVTDYDYWVVKLNSVGAIEWQNTIGGNSADRLMSVQQTSDSGYILGGYSGSGISRDKTEASSGDDYWVVKLDSTGSIEWQNTIGGSITDQLKSIQQTSDDGYILGGYSDSDISGDKTEASSGSYDYWVVKLDTTGAIEWQRTIGGSGDDELFSVQQTTGGGYILGGFSDSDISGDKTEASIGLHDYWVVKVDSTGSIEWQETIGGSSDDRLYSIQQTSDNGYVLGGYSNSDSSGNKTEASSGSYDYWVVKLDLFVCNGLTVYVDGDDDGYGDTNNSFVAADCIVPDGYVLDTTDCNDANAAVNPGASDICNSIDDNCDNVIDENAIIATVTPAGTATTCTGVSITLTANSGAGISYQWKKGNNNIAGATNSTYSTSKAGNYKVNESNSFGCSATSAVTTLSVVSAPSATITPLGNLDICAAGSVVLQANSGSGYTYQWMKGANLIASATNQTYTATKAATYKVTVTSSNNCSKTSAGAKVTKSCKLGDEGGEDLPELVSEMHLYPNPTSGKFMIELNLPEEVSNARVYVINILGQTVFAEKVEITDGMLRKEIQLSNADAWGSYIIQVITDDEVYSSQLIYQR